MILGLQIGEKIGLVKHAIRANSLYFLYLLLLSISKVLASFQPTLWPSSYACWANFDPLWDCACVLLATRLEVSLFRLCRFCHIHRECYRRPVPSVADLFPAWFSWGNSWGCVYFWKSSWCCTDSLYNWNTLHVWDIHRTQRLFFFIQTTETLGISDRVNENLGITVELEITSQAAGFFSQVLSFSVVQTLNQTSFHMRRMVRVGFL
jgi:hypothetical protein